MMYQYNGEVHHPFQKAIKATKAFHDEILRRFNHGEDPELVTLDIARRVLFYKYASIRYDLRANPGDVKAVPVHANVVDLIKLW
jgi:hypothetical protein